MGLMMSMPTYLETYKITMFQTPPSWNKWNTLHWGAQKRFKEQWLKEFQVEARHVPKRRLLLVDLSCSLIFPTNRGRDVDNFQTSYKVSKDCMKKLEIIIDDRPQYVRHEEPPELHVVKGCIPTTVIWIHVVEEGAW